VSILSQSWRIETKDTEMPLVTSTTFHNAHLCISGSVVPGSFTVDHSKGLITSLHVDRPPSHTHTESELLLDLQGAVVAPGLLELQTNGLLGFHFTHFEDEAKYQNELERVAKFFVTKGVTGFWATIPTVSQQDFRKVDEVFQYMRFVSLCYNSSS
jgi:N-acetylglucosamine-6-phosphate deacetylase